ncbi:class II fructose-bisphosphate aldolase [Marinococcus halophilus]|uniref:class II fructose-bisphosphate aldolase n=1 Tax=Marinococcus halophilus TaxID=1371 RepID=UPI0009A72126|nr:class II fructose-bisphosphate aldolase [Marinococcus halophilus]
MICDFNNIMKKAAKGQYALAAFNVFGYEDAVSVVRAAEEMNAPILLATNKQAIDHMPVEHWGNLLRLLAEEASVPISIHMDHAKDYQTVARAIKSGYTSIMYDGSHLPFEENVKATKEITNMAHAFGIPVEGEIGKLSYDDLAGHKTEYTIPEEAEAFAAQTGVDWLAVSIGTVQRMQKQKAAVQFGRLEAIETLVNLPLVIHGSTGVEDAELKRLTDYNVAKLNIGTALRMAFGQTLTKEVQHLPEQYDRLKLFEKPMDKVKIVAKHKLNVLGFEDSTYERKHYV